MTSYNQGGDNRENYLLAEIAEGVSATAANMIGYNYVTKQATVAEIDTVSPSLVTIDFPHHQVHEGEMFRAWKAYDNNAIAATNRLYIQVPANCYPHLNVSVAATASVFVRFYESANVTASGTAVTSFNADRNKSFTPYAKVYSAPTVNATGYGTQFMPSLRVGSGSGSNRAGGSDRSSQEVVLKASTKYLIVASNRVAGNSFSVNLDWYEQGLAL